MKKDSRDKTSSIKMAKNQSKMFVITSRQNLHNALVEKISLQLMGRGCVVNFFSELPEESDGNFDKKIFSELADSELVLAFWDRETLKSQYVIREIEYAAKKNIPVVSVLVDIDEEDLRTIAHFLPRHARYFKVENDDLDTLADNVSNFISNESYIDRPVRAAKKNVSRSCLKGCLITFIFAILIIGCFSVCFRGCSKGSKKVTAPLVVGKKKGSNKGNVSFGSNKEHSIRLRQLQLEKERIIIEEITREVLSHHAYGVRPDCIPEEIMLKMKEAGVIDSLGGVPNRTRLLSYLDSTLMANINESRELEMFYETHYGHRDERTHNDNLDNNAQEVKESSQEVESTNGGNVLLWILLGAFGSSTLILAIMLVSSRLRKKGKKIERDTHIKCFIAGSLELDAERDAIRAAIDVNRNKFRKWNIEISSYTFEDFSSVVVENGQQQLYNKFIEDEATWTIFIIGDHVNPHTKEEFDVAYNAFLKQKHPKILIFAKDCENPTVEVQDLKAHIMKAQQYWITYSTLKEIKGAFSDHLTWDVMLAHSDLILK